MAGRRDPSRMRPMQTMNRPIGELLRDWRQRRRRSQLDLALDAEVSTRHISFIETGRAQPSREMLLRLFDHLEVPLRERNTLLTAAGYAPVYLATPLDEPAMAAARQAIEMLLAGYEPYPALAIDRYWNLVIANRAVALLLDGVAPELLEPPVNVLRLSLRVDGIASRVENFAQWREHALGRLRQQVETTGDPVLTALLEEVRAYSTPNAGRHREPIVHSGVIFPLRIRTGAGVLSFFTATTVFGTATDITLSELAIESFLPADAETAAALRLVADGG